MQCDRLQRYVYKLDLYLKYLRCHTQLGNFNYGQELNNTAEPTVPFKRKLSKREKKELKKQEKLAKLKVRFIKGARECSVGPLLKVFISSRFRAVSVRKILGSPFGKDLS